MSISKTRSIAALTASLLLMSGAALAQTPPTTAPAETAPAPSEQAPSESVQPTPSPATPPAARPPARSDSTAKLSSDSAVKFVSSQGANEMTTESLIGLSVTNAAGDAVGDINYIVLDENGQAIAAVIGVGGFLGVGEKNIGVAFEGLKFAVDSNGKQTAQLSVTKETLSSAPAYQFNDNKSRKTTELIDAPKNEPSKR